MAEERAATPGWVEEWLDEIFAAHPIGAASTGCRAAYLSCLADCRGAIYAEAGHDRCRAAFLRCLREKETPHALVDALAPELEDLEAEISERT